MNQTDTEWIAVLSQGSFFKLENDALYYSPMLQDSSMKIEDEYNVASLSAHTEEDYEEIFSILSIALDRNISKANLDY